VPRLFVGNGTGSEINLRKTGKKLTLQSWGIAPKIRDIDDALQIGSKKWAFEVHPELCFREMNRQNLLRYSKRKEAGRFERTQLLTPYFPGIRQHLANRESGVGADDLLDAAAAAWTAIRHYQGKAESVGAACVDERGLPMRIYF